MAVQAIAKGVRLSPRKVMVVAALVRGRTVADALVILDNTPRRSALAVSKAIKSARANAEHNHNYKPATLQITEISVTAGPRTKRFRPVARGMAHPYQKKTAHIRVIVDGEQREAKKPAKSPAKVADVNKAEKGAA
ncbi:MAG TPA: 50S ribosomal protein L22 [Candidatus Saccharimonadales bacterium]|jgi:large subunit ribosomal protein L22|nr:50S ribosomal protein L22 [Candidatus Saccharimonadales bacterium]